MMVFNNLQRQLKAEIKKQRRVLKSKETIINGEIKYAWLPVAMSSGKWVWLSKYREHPAGYYLNSRGAISRMVTPFCFVVEAYPAYKTVDLGPVNFHDLTCICDFRVPAGDVVKTINAIRRSIHKTRNNIQDMEDHLYRLKPVW